MADRSQIPVSTVFVDVVEVKVRDVTLYKSAIAARRYLWLQRDTKCK